MATTQKSTDLPRLIPTGTCWCGCGIETSLGAFFARGHDKVAEGALLAVAYGGSVAQLLHANGYNPGRSVTKDAVASGVWDECPKKDCDYSGTPASIKVHRRRYSH